VIELNPRDIDLGERAGRDPGDLTDLMESLESAGMAHLVTVTPGYRLVTGRRRLEACRKLGHPVPAEVITTVAEALEHLVRENADGRCVKPVSLIETMELDAAIRELQWWPKRPPGHGLPAGGDSHTGEIAAVLGLNGQQYRRAREVFMAAHGYRDAFGKRYPVDDETRRRAESALPGMTSLRAITGAHHRFKTGTPSLRDPRAPIPRQQERAIESAIAALTGLTAGFRSAVPAGPGIPAETAAQWDADITTAMDTLRSFRRQLRKQEHDSR
jgi:ParB-like nuclease family protein